MWVKGMQVSYVSITLIFAASCVSLQFPNEKFKNYQRINLSVFYLFKLETPDC